MNAGAAMGVVRKGNTTMRATAIAFTTLLAASALAGCASDPSFGERLTANAERATEGERLIRRGEAMIERGRRRVGRGEDEINEGRDMIERGEALLRQARTEAGV